MVVRLKRRRERRGPLGGLTTLAGGSFAHQGRGGATGAPSRLVYDSIVRHRVTEDPPAL